MRLVATRRLTPGTRLGRDVPDVRGGSLPLLRAGVSLTTRHIQSLVGAGINAVYVDDPLGAGIDVPQAISERTRHEAREALQAAIREAPASILKGRPLPDTVIGELQSVVTLIASEIAAAPDAALAFADLAGADAYVLEHSIDVTIVGLLVAERLFRTRGRVDFRGRRSFDRVDQHLTQLGTGLLLHDIGKLAIPRWVLNKPGALDEEEWRIVRRHPVTGIEMLAGDAIGARAKSVVRSHHERWDGNGYPDGHAGERISQFARIASVADVFDAITSERAYAPAAPQHVGVQAIAEGSGTAFDPEVAGVFSEVIAPYPPGDAIVLADGRSGVVVSVPAERLDAPLVRVAADAEGTPVDPYEIDLAEHPELMPQPGRAVA